MPKFNPVETELGVLKGRDCIILDNIAVEYIECLWVLQGEINGELCSKNIPNDSIGFILKFYGVLALTMAELDSFKHTKHLSDACFIQVENSDWLKELSGKVTDIHKHFILGTYDDVFEIVCKEFELIINPYQ